MGRGGGSGTGLTEVGPHERRHTPAHQRGPELLPFVRLFGEPVFDIEYSVSTAQFCPEAKRLGLTAMRKHLSLDSWRDACP